MRTRSAHTFLHSLLAIAALIFALFLVLVFTGCDDGTSITTPPDGDSPTFQGRVSDDAGYGKTTPAVEGAAVTAAAVESNGSLRTLAGEVITDAEGRFVLTVEEEADADFYVLSAAEGDFRSQVLVSAEGQVNDIIQAMPMSAESNAEADVYLEVRSDPNTESNSAAAADVAASVNAQLALALEASPASAAEVAAAIQADARAQTEYVNEREDVDDDASNDVDQAEHDAFVQLQLDLAAATSTSAQNEALVRFENALIDAYTEAGVSLEVQAKARQSGEAALLRFATTNDAETRFSLHKRTTILTAMATALAVEAAFEAEGAAQSRLDALADARTTFVTNLRAAVSESEIDAAEAQYRTSVEAELTAELEINEAVLVAAETALSPVKTTLEASISAAGSAADVAMAYVSFFTSAESTVESALSVSGKAQLGAQVLALLSVQ